MIILSPLLCRLLLQNEFYDAWVFVPFLLIYASFNIESGVWGGVFSAKKDAFAMTFSTIMGAVANVLFCLCLVPFFGAYGAAFAAMIAGFVIWAIRAKRISRHISSNFRIKRTALLYGLLFFQALLMVVLQNDITSYIIQLIFVSTILIVLRKELYGVSQLICNTIKNKLAIIFKMEH